MKQLTDSKVFSTYANVLSMAAIIGFRNSMYIHIDRPASDGVLMQFFTEEEKDLIDLIAYAHSGSQNILKKDQKYEVFESYANGGFPILADKLEISSDDLILDKKSLLLKMYQILITDDVEMTSINNLDDLLFE